MKIKVEITDKDEEIIIKCKEKDDKITLLETVISNLFKGNSELKGYIGNTVHYLQTSQILFFEAYGGKVYAHTVKGMYLVKHKLFELSGILPYKFERVSKSVIVNIKLIESLKKELTGNGEITFYHSDKKIFFSRGYYKSLVDKIDEVRFKNE